MWGNGSLPRCIHVRLQQRIMSGTGISRPMETSSGNFRDAQPEDQQFARFLETANQLGEHLNSIFNNGFAKIVANPSLTPHPVAQTEPATPTVENDDTFRRNVDRTEQSSKTRKTPLGEKTEQPQSPSLGIESSLVVRLHFAEAMMVLMFNVLSEPQQSSIKRHFDDLLRRSENVEVMGVPPSTFQGYRDTLRAMQNMLASNPTPEAMATALAHDFAKRYSARPKGDDGAAPPPAG
jgi:hypothetical protein